MVEMEHEIYSTLTQEASVAVHRLASIDDTAYPFEQVPIGNATMLREVVEVSCPQVLSSGWSQGLQDVSARTSQGWTDLSATMDEVDDFQNCKDPK